MDNMTYAWAAIRRDTDEPTYTIKVLTVEEAAALESMGLAVKRFYKREDAREYAREQRHNYVFKIESEFDAGYDYGVGDIGEDEMMNQDDD